MMHGTMHDALPLLAIFRTKPAVRRCVTWKNQICIRASLEALSSALILISNPAKTLRKCYESRTMADFSSQEDVPQMSGALSEQQPEPQRSSRVVLAESLDHVYSAEAGGSSVRFNARNTRENDAPGSITMADETSRQQNTQESTFMPSRGIKSTQKHRKLNQKSSLEDVLRLSLNGLPSSAPETRIPLPESKPASPVDTSSLSDISRTSLDLITEKGVFQEDEVTNLPLTVPLPVSRHPSVRRERRRSTREGPQSWQDPFSLTIPDYDYEAIKTRASELFSHLRHGKMHEETRHSLLQSNIAHVDFPPSPFVSDMVVEVVDQSGATAHEFESAYKNTPLRVRQRVIIVEDLSHEIIQFLGGRYGVSPELFEEHLINSGYAGADYDDLSAATWATARMKKSHVSVKWHRPVHRLPVAPYSKQDLRDLLDPRLGRLEYTLHKTSDLGIFLTETNILRSEWELWTDPSINPRKTRSCGWEERASIWTQLLPNGCRIGKPVTFILI